MTSNRTMGPEAIADGLRPHQMLRDASQGLPYGLPAHFGGCSHEADLLNTPFPI